MCDSAIHLLRVSFCFQFSGGAHLWDQKLQIECLFKLSVSVELNNGLAVSHSVTDTQHQSLPPFTSTFLPVTPRKASACVLFQL